MCLTQSTWKVQNGKPWSAVKMTPCCPPPMPFYGSANEVNSSSADAQVVSCHRYLVVFYPCVEQLTVFHTSGLVLALSSILRVLESWAARAKQVRKLCLNRYISTINPWQTYIQTQPQTKFPLAPTAPATITLATACRVNETYELLLYVWVLICGNWSHVEAR